MEDKSVFEVFSPVDGIVTDIKDVPDEAFSGGYLGPGIAIAPAGGCIKAPFDGKIKTLHKALHAVVIESGGLEVLIHIGVETVTLNGKGFKAFCKEGDSVKKGQTLIECDLDFIAQNIPSNLVIVLVAEPQDAQLSLTPAQTPLKAGGRLFTVQGDFAPRAEEQAQTGQQVFTAYAVVNIKEGLHARPAAAIAKTANTFDNCLIRISKNGRCGNAKSLVEILGLGVNYRDKIEFSACGDNAQEALSAVVKVAGRAFSESSSQTENTAQELDFSKETDFKGKGLYPGLVIGRIVHLQRATLKIEENSALSPQEETLKLTNALKSVRQILEEEISSCDDKNRVEILKAHLIMLADPFLTEYSSALIKDGKTAAFAWDCAVEESIKILDKSANILLKERKADYRDIRSRVLNEICGFKPKEQHFPENTILITDELLSGEFSRLEGKISGLVMAGGSQTSHIAIMLKNSSLPSLISAGKGVLSIPQDIPAVLDSAKGFLIVNPPDLDKYRRQSEQVKTLRIKAQESAFEPAVTKDGVLIEVKGNIGSLEEAEKSAKSGTDGIGLLRSEFLFSSFRSEPTEEEQFELYSKIAESQNGKSVIIRTFDTGGDKPLPFFPLPKEENPIAGLRGIRTYHLAPDLLRRQVRAIMRVKPYGTAKIMLPMVSFVDELRKYRDIIRQEQAALGIDKVSVGIMVEVPSVAVMANIFAGCADFMSLGTNDLTQYTLAIDRGNGSVSNFADTLNPAVLKLIYMTAEAANAASIPLGVCGAAAGDIYAVPLLIGLGLRSLSVPYGLAAEIKYFIRGLDTAACRDLAFKCLNMESSLQVRSALKNIFSL